jgi:hypothetical protein
MGTIEHDEDSCSLEECLTAAERRDPALVLRAGNRLIPITGAIADLLESPSPACQELLTASATLTWFPRDADVGPLKDVALGVPIGVIRFVRRTVPREIPIFRPELRFPDD